MRRASKTKLPTHYQAGILKLIARSRLIKTRLPDRQDPLWEIDGIGEIPDACAQALIRAGWLVPQRDGLTMFEESRDYLARVPG